jgi:hypothetical protein
MRRAERLVLVLCGLLPFAEQVQPAWSENPDYRYPLAVPEVPASAALVVYGPIPPGLGGPEGEKSKDWQEILTKMGVSFPPGGFAIFYRPARVLIVATDQANQDLVAIICE